MAVRVWRRPSGPRNSCWCLLEVVGLAGGALPCLDFHDHAPDVAVLRGSDRERAQSGLSAVGVHGLLDGIGHGTSGDDDPVNGNTATRHGSPRFGLSLRPLELSEDGGK